MIIEELPAAVKPGVRRFTTEEFHRMIEAGVLYADERVELLDGEIMLLFPVGDPHVGCVDRLNDILGRRLHTHDPQPAFVSVQNPVRLSEHDDPLPDVILKHPDARDRAPTADETFLIIEVATSSLAYDRGPKLQRYALHGIPEVWVVALERERVYVYRDPIGDEYRTLHTLRRGDALDVYGLPDLGSIPVDDVLGPEQQHAE